MRKATRPWIKKAEDDYETAENLSAGGKRLYDQICFHCQQCVEKYLKALLEESAQTIPKIHDCVKLFRLLPADYQSLNAFQRGFTTLNRYAVATRYPGENATRRQAASALRWAVKVRTVCREFLGLK